MADKQPHAPPGPVDDELSRASVERSTKIMQSTLLQHGFSCPESFHGLVIRTPSPVHSEADCYFSESEADDDDFPIAITADELVVDYDEVVDIHKTSNDLLDKSRNIRLAGGKALEQRVLTLHRGLAKAVGDFQDANLKARKELEALIPKLATMARWESCLNIMELGFNSQTRAITRKVQQYDDGFLDITAYINFLDKSFSKEANTYPGDYDTSPVARFNALFCLCAPIWKTKHALMTVLRLMSTVLYRGESRMCVTRWQQRQCDALMRKMLWTGFGYDIEPEDPFIRWNKDTDVCEAFRYLANQWRAKDCSRCLRTEVCFHRVHAELLRMLHVKARASIRHNASLVAQWVVLPPEMENLVYSSLLAVEEVPMLDVATPTTTTFQSLDYPDGALPHFQRALVRYKTRLSPEWRCARTGDGVATITLEPADTPYWFYMLYWQPQA